MVNSNFRFQSLLSTVDSICTYGSWVTIADDAFLKIMTSPMKHRVDQIAASQGLLLRPSTIETLPREMFKVPEDDVIVPPCCSFPCFKIYVITSMMS